MPIKKVKDYLNSNDIKYVIISHSPAYTSMEVAASAHVCGHDLAKTVMVKIDGKMTMVVLPASYKIDFGLLKELTGTNNVELAEEDEFKVMFPNCEVGAMPPFGNLYNMEVFVSETLTMDIEIAFAAGFHNELIKMTYKDFKNLVNPIVMKISVLA
ncbi:MAG: YbaK/EbsC family protein [Bacteroidales bacterium]|jgi:Ala-tRNA(Pro) deacylase|nr:YbaK/EbsC family protein [Bacteroidales bacterium]